MKAKDRSIPYAQRLAMKKADEILAQRDEAATLALGVMMCTLADEYGFGYSRLCRLARETMQNIHDVYAAEDPWIEVEHIRQRLRQLGFTVTETGKIYGHVDEDGNPVAPAQRKTIDGGNDERTSQEKHP